MEKSDIDTPRDQALWDLLGQARQVEASPFFVRKVLRAIEEKPVVESAWMRWFRMVAPVTACAVITLAAVAGMWAPRSSHVVSADPSLEFDTIENLDLLVANYESSIWLNGSSSLPSF